MEENVVVSSKTTYAFSFDPPILPLRNLSRIYTFTKKTYIGRLLIMALVVITKYWKYAEYLDVGRLLTRLQNTHPGTGGTL